MPPVRGHFPAKRRGEAFASPFLTPWKRRASARLLRLWCPGRRCAVGAPGQAEHRGPLCRRGQGVHLIEKADALRRQIVVAGAQLPPQPPLPVLPIGRHTGAGLPGPAKAAAPAFWPVKRRTGGWVCRCAGPRCPPAGWSEADRLALWRRHTDSTPRLRSR